MNLKREPLSLGIQKILLKGSIIYLEPITETHRNDLFEAAQNELIWTYSATKGLGDNFHRWFDKAILKALEGSQLPFVVRRLKDQGIIGSTRLYDIDLKQRRSSIGYTWYIPEVWGSSVNVECKFLMLNHAFENLKLHRIEFFTDVRNLHARSSLQKLGAVEEGVLRHHMILEDGFVRDTAVLSIIKPDWPLIKSKLEQHL